MNVTEMIFFSQICLSINLSEYYSETWLKKNTTQKEMAI